MDDSDLWGALIYVCSYGAFLALSGKFAWGYIYGIALFGSIALHWIFALMTPPADPSDSNDQYAQMQQAQGLRDHSGHFSATLTYSRSASVLGYCFLPLSLIALFGVLLPMDSFWGYCLTSCAVGWCTYSSSGMFVSVGRMSGMRGLVAYPLALFYCGFVIMAFLLNDRRLSSLRREEHTGLAFTQVTIAVVHSCGHAMLIPVVISLHCMGIPYHANQNLRSSSFRSDRIYASMQISVGLVTFPSHAVPHFNLTSPPASQSLYSKKSP